MTGSGLSTESSTANRRAAARLAKWLLALGVALVLLPAAAGYAAVLHAYEPEVSAKLDEGVPATSGAAVPGPITGAWGLAADSGRLWVAELFKEGENPLSRVDAFDGSTGAFVSQLAEAPTLSDFSSGVAVGHATGEEEVYVGAGESVVGVFGPAGALQATWTGANTPNGSFTQSGPEAVARLNGVAVDESTNTLEDWAAGDVYVTTHRREVTSGGHLITGEEFASYNVVDVFSPQAGGAEPPKVVAQITGTCETPATCPGKAIPFERPSAVAVSAQTGEVLVVDGRRRVDVFQPTGLGEYAFVRQLTGRCPTAGVCPGEEIPFEELSAVAVDSGNGEIYVAEGSSAVDQFGAEGEYLGRITSVPSGPLGEVRSVAVDGTSHNLYIGDRHPGAPAASVDAFGADLVVPDVTTGAVTEPTSEGAVLHGTANPDGAGEASCRFLYGTTPALGSEVPCSQPVPEGTSPFPVQATLGGLEPDTTYYYRLQASNGNGTTPGEESQDRHFKTAGPGIHSESVAGVTADSATLQATIDPNGAPTSYYFEYGTTGAYGALAPAAPGTPVGPVEAEVAEHVQGLQPSTLYHYRAVAVAEVSPGRTQSFVGPDRTLTTQGSASGLALPDGRQWELVSPSDKHGAEIETIQAVTQAAASGNAMALLATAPTESEPAGFANLVQIISRRLPGGWEARDVSTPHDTATGIGGSGYRFFSRELERAVIQPEGAFVPSLAASASEQTPYLRDVVSGEALCTANCYAPLVTGCPAAEAECRPVVAEHANVPAGTAFGEEGQCPPPETSAIKKGECGPEALAATDDLSHIVLKSPFALTPGAPTGGALYEWSAGTLELISRLPNGEAVGHSEYFVGDDTSHLTRNAVSSDGARVVWTDKAHLYVRDVAAGETVQLDTPALGASGVGESVPQFQTASRDTKRIFFTDQNELTADAGPGKNLYECELVMVGGKDQCALRDLTPGSGSVRGEALELPVGASDDGSWVYFVADGVLAPGAEEGSCPAHAEPVPPTYSCNLYVWHEGVTKLVATLSAADGPDWNGFGQPSELEALTARVTPDGHWLAFMSQRPLTGYDNRDAVTGQPDEEAFLYDAIDGRLVCVSCMPTGGRPTGITYTAMKEALGSAVWRSSARLAASLPAWLGNGRSESGSHQPRFLDDSGRMFFNTPDALVPEDSNGVGDVYEFEPAGVGGCDAAAGSGTTVYLAGAGGCVSLISSGASAEESRFVDASESGGDVFFLTNAQLAGADGDRQPDIYDAHECSVSAPCFPVQPAAVPPCDTGDSCKAAPSPQPGVFGAPSSATFSGSGNPAPTVAAGTNKPKGLAHTRAKLTRALRACREKRKRGARLVCERQARKRYAARKSSPRVGIANGRGGQ